MAATETTGRPTLALVDCRRCGGGGETYPSADPTVTAICAACAGEGEAPVEVLPLPAARATLVAHLAQHRADRGDVLIHGGRASANELWWEHYRAHHRGEDSPRHAHDWSEWANVVASDDSQVVA